MSTRTNTLEVAVMLEKLKIRAVYIQQHQSLTQSIFKNWPTGEAAVNPHAWDNISTEIAKTKSFIEDNARMFPNRIIHIETWSFLLEIAAIRKANL